MPIVSTGLLVALLSCAGNRPPQIQPIPDQNAIVGTELVIELRANDPEGDRVQFDFAAPGLPDLKTRASRATLSSSISGVAYFRWTPQGDDASDTPYQIDFIASDGKKSTSETVQVTVRGQSGSGAPVFRQPIGTGTTLDLSKESCIEVAIVVEDTDSTETTIALEPPLIDGAEFEQTDAFTATWKWCPSADQVARQPTYKLTLSATDESGHKTTKTYVIVIKPQCKGDVPGAPPAISHTSSGSISTSQDIGIVATVTDDLGIKTDPLVYYFDTPPAMPIDLATATAFVPMARTAGDALSGTYEGKLPNPVAAQPAGTKKTLYYVISATDNDDGTGPCDHSAVAPVSGTYELEVTSTGMAALGPCEPCSTDAQCGTSADHCITVGTGHFCAQACGGSNPACPSGYQCSSGAVVSVDGASSQQCQPVSGSCGSTTVCTDDGYEENDSRTNIVNASAAAMSAGTVSNLMMCPGDGSGDGDEDWYAVPITVDTQVSATINFALGGTNADLDLELYTAGGAMVDFSYGVDASETVSHCFPASAQKALIGVFTLDDSPPATPYSMVITKTPMSCCTDAQEPNNDYNTNKALLLGTNTFNGLKICQGDEDWWYYNFAVGNRIVVDVVGSNSQSDIDIHFYKLKPIPLVGADDLTPCCNTSNGQSSSSVEHFEWTIKSAALGEGAGTYFVVVRPYTAGGTNAYNMTATISVF